MAGISTILAGVGAAAGVGSAISGARAARDQNRLQQQALQQATTELGGFNFNSPWGMAGGWDPSNNTLNLSAGGLDSLRTALSQYATGMVPRADSGMPQDLAATLAQLQTRAGQGPDLGLQGLDMLSGAVGSQFQNAQQALQSLGAGGFQRPLQNTAFAGAGQQIADLSRGFGDVEARTLANLRASAQPFEQRQFNSLQDNLFATGRLGTSGGGLQTEAFARGLGQADLQRQLAATGEARSVMGQTLANAQGLAGIGSGLAGQESDLLSSAFARFGQTASLASDLNRERFSRSAFGNQLGFDRMGQLFGLQQQASLFPSQLQGAQLQNVLAALGGQAGIQTQSLQGFQAALAAAQAQANARIGAGSNMASIVGNPNFASSGYGTANMLGQLAQQFSPAGGSINALIGAFAQRPPVSTPSYFEDFASRIPGNVPPPIIGGL